MERRYLRLCKKFRAVIRYMKAAFYRPDYQKLLICLLIKRLDLVSVSKHTAKPLKLSDELMKHSGDLLRV